MNAAKLIDEGILCAAAGGILGMLCELASLVWQFYYAHLAAALCFAAGLLAGLGHAACRRVSLGQAARKLDSFGLKERMITAYEQMDKEDELAQLQRQDAYWHYGKARERIKISILPDKRHVLALAISLAAVAGLGFIPSPTRELAEIRHQVQEQAGEEREKLEEFMDALKGVDLESLTEEQMTLLQELAEMMELSREELGTADSWEKLASVKERLDYKYGQAAGSLESLAGQMANPELAGIAAAEALAKAANQNGKQMASSGTPGGDFGDGDDSGEGGGSRQGEDSGQGDGSGQGGGAGQGDGSGQGEGSGQGDDSGQGDGSGQGEGSGQGGGSGEGEGSGQGEGSQSGSGSGPGNGRGTGSGEAVHDYVSVPNAVGGDSSLTGDKNGDRDSDYYRQQNGIAWEGEHIDYNSVIGQYTENAYEGIANGKYPSGMESVIRDYFENLSK